MAEEKSIPEQSLSLDDLGLIRQRSVAKLLGKTLRTVQRMTERGELPPTITMARDQFYRKETILANLAERERRNVRLRGQQPPKPRKRRRAHA